LRGSGWDDYIPCRAAVRHASDPGYTHEYFFGFRCVLVGGAAPKVLHAAKRTGEMLAGQTAWPAGAKKPPN
jgi:hypothetical protein